MPKLTKTLVEAIEPESKDVIVWDSDIKGFCVKVTPKGSRVYMLYYRIAGRQRKPKIGTHGAITCEQARNYAKEWLAEVTQGKDPSNDKQKARKTPTIAELADRYIEEYAINHKKPESVRMDKLNFSCHIVPALGKYSIFNIARKDILDFYRGMKEHPVSANRCLALLSNMFKKSEEWGLRLDATSLCKHIDKYPEKKRERYLSNEEIERLGNVLREAEINKTESLEAIAAIKLYLFTGCRKSEILNLKWSEVDLKNQSIRLLDSKTGARTVQLSAPAIELLSKKSKTEGNPYVICGREEGQHLVNLRKAWVRICKEAGIKNLRINDLRHSFASVGVSGGMSLALIKGLLGHTQIKTTERYAHLANDPLKLAVNSIGIHMANALEGKKAKVVKLRGVKSR